MTVRQEMRCFHVSKILFTRLWSILFFLTACEKDTYGDVRGLLHPYSKEGEPEENKCKKCPRNSVTKKGVIAQSVADCECDVGYTGNPASGVPCDRKLLTVLGIGF